MTYEDIFFYIQKYYKIIGASLLIFLLFLMTLVAKDNNNDSSENVQLPTPSEVKEEMTSNEPVEEEKTTVALYVDIKGAVAMPGVYAMDEGDRVIDVVNMAGGLDDEADTMRINLSQLVRDEMVIIIPHETDDEIADEELITKDGGEDEAVEKDDGLVCLSSASVAELATLPGIGEARAEDIIAYRDEHGFSEISEIKNVTGIGPAIFADIKDLLKV